MKISEALNLGKSQPQLAFVDVDLSTDIPLFIDPAAFREQPSYFAKKCQADIENFFETVLDAAKRKDVAEGLRLLSALTEPDETHLGLSKGRPRGRGLNRKLARKIFANMAQSKAVDTGLVSDLSDAFMFIYGIGPDIVSDMTTNIIRRHLIEFTQEQFEHHRLEIESEVPTGILWDPVERDWIEGQFDLMPVINGRRVILVPKQIVRWRREFQKNGRKFYREFFSNFVRQRQLHENGPLVTLVEKDGRVVDRKVYQKDIQKHYPNTKSNLENFAIDRPHEYDRFKRTYIKHSPLSDASLMSYEEGYFRENAFCADLVKALAAVPKGRRHATDYQDLVTGIAHFLFYPHLTNPVTEREINEGRKRIDISFDNDALEGFFALVRTDPQFHSREVMMECKNYNEDISNPEIDQLAMRFDDRRGRFGILFCRGIENGQRAQDRCRDALQAKSGAIVILTDADLVEMLEADMLKRSAVVQRVLKNQMRNLIS